MTKKETGPKPDINNLIGPKKMLTKERKRKKRRKREELN